MSVAKQRYRAVLAVISDGRTVKEVAAGVGVSRQTLPAWLARYEAGGLEQLADRSHRPRGCPHQMPSEVEAAVLQARRNHPSWGPRRIAFELNTRSPTVRVTESAVYRCLRRAGLVEPDGRRRRRRDWKRWERGRPNELWQMDVVWAWQRGLRRDGTASLLRLRRRHPLRRAGADRLVDHLPDLLIQPVLLPDAVRGP